MIMVILLGVFLGVSLGNAPPPAAPVVSPCPRILVINNASDADILSAHNCTSIEDLQINATTQNLTFSTLKRAQKISFTGAGNENVTVAAVFPNLEAIDRLAVVNTNLSRLSMPRLLKSSYLSFTNNPSLHNLHFPSLLVCLRIVITNSRLHVLSLPHVRELNSLSFSRSDIGKVSLPKLERINQIQLTDISGFSANKAMLSEPKQTTPDPVAMFDQIKGWLGLTPEGEPVDSDIIPVLGDVSIAVGAPPITAPSRRPRPWQETQTQQEDNYVGGVTSGGYPIAGDLVSEPSLEPGYAIPPAADQAFNPMPVGDASPLPADQIPEVMTGPVVPAVAGMVVPQVDGMVNPEVEGAKVSNGSANMGSGLGGTNGLDGSAGSGGYGGSNEPILILITSPLTPEDSKDVANNLDGGEEFKNVSNVTGKPAKDNKLGLGNFVLVHNGTFPRSTRQRRMVVAPAPLPLATTAAPIPDPMQTAPAQTTSRIPIGTAVVLDPRQTTPPSPDVPLFTTLTPTDQGIPGDLNITNTTNTTSDDSFSDDLFLVSGGDLDENLTLLWGSKDGKEPMANTFIYAPSLLSMDSFSMTRAYNFSALVFENLVTLGDFQCVFCSFTKELRSPIRMPRAVSINSFYVYRADGIGDLVLPQLYRLETLTVSQTTNLQTIQLAINANSTDTMTDPSQMFTISLSANSDLIEAVIGAPRTVIAAVEIVFNSKLQRFALPSLETTGSLVVMHNEQLRTLDVGTLTQGNIIINQNTMLGGDLTLPFLHSTGMVVICGNQFTSININGLAELNSQRVTYDPSVMWAMATIWSRRGSSPAGQPMIVVESEPVTSISMELLQTVPNIRIANCKQLPRLSLPMLRVVEKDLEVSGLEMMDSLNLPNLVSVTSLNLTSNGLMELSLPALETAKAVGIIDHDYLYTVEMPFLQRVDGLFIVRNPTLANVSLDWIGRIDTYFVVEVNLNLCVVTGIFAPDIGFNGDSLNTTLPLLPKGGCRVGNYPIIMNNEVVTVTNVNATTCSTEFDPGCCDVNLRDRSSCTIASPAQLAQVAEAYATENMYPMDFWSR